ncbi:MAG TPA: 3-oxoacyl-ACP reductase [Planctomycetaceae bacterium]|nr:3-oxoacyl-ACP reductase [Planctomycetaceae bacterium]
MSTSQYPTPQPHLPLAELCAVVTGASGGIGRQIAIAFAVAGAKRIGIHFARNHAAAQQTADEVSAAGAEPILLQADCGSREACRELVDDAFKWFGRPDVWVHAAGADVLTGEAQNWDFDQKLAHLIDVDLIGSIVVGREYARRIREADSQQSGQQPASLMLIGWDQATEGMEGDGGQMFAPVKAGVEAFARSLAQEYAPQVRVNTLAPGWIMTSWGETVNEYWDRRAKGQSLMQRWGSAADVAAAAVFLASPASNFITGQTLNINGGFSRRWERNEP